VTSLWTRAGLPWRELARRIGREILEDDIFGRSAELAYYFLFALFPLLLFLASVFGHVLGGRIDLQRELFEYLAAVIPSPDAFALVRDTLQEVIDRRGLRFSFGLVVSLVVAAQGIAGVGRVLDTAFEVKVRRPLWRAQAVAIGLTLAFAVLTLAALVLIFYGDAIAALLAARLPYGSAFGALWEALRWPLGLAFVVSAFELVYNFAPAEIDRRRLHLTSPGAVAAVGLWLAASFGLKAYLSRFGLYAVTYGSLAAVVALLLWFYVAGFAILVGGEINAEIHKALAEREGKG
jgi:membrane protein